LFRAQSVAEIAEREGVTDRYVRRLMRLAFLAPEIVEAIIAGNQPPELTAEALAERIDLPLLWTAQEQAVGIAQSACVDHFRTILAEHLGESVLCRASRMDGTASLANRDFGCIMRASSPKMVFSGAAQHANNAAGAGYFADSSRESADWGLDGGEGGLNPRGTFIPAGFRVRGNTVRQRPY
jgi:hypothetical protein